MIMNSNKGAQDNKPSLSLKGLLFMWTVIYLIVALFAGLRHRETKHVKSSHDPVFKVGDCYREKGFEDWDAKTDPIYKVLQVGRTHYQVITGFPPLEVSPSAKMTVPIEETDSNKELSDCSLGEK